MKSVSYLIWGMIGIIILAGVGLYFVSSGTGKRGDTQQIRKPPTEQTFKTRPQYEKLDQALREALTTARKAAKDDALAKLDHWVGELRKRVDDNFLDWYFGYWNTQIRGIEAIYYEAMHWMDGDRPRAAEKITEEIQEQFAVRVLQPRTAQIRIERIAQDAVESYVTVLSSELKRVPEKYGIPQSHWERYLSDMAGDTSRVEGGRTVPITLKALYVSGAAGAAVAVSQVIAYLGPKMAVGFGGSAAAKVASTAVGKMAAKTGGKVAAKIGGKFLGPIVGVGIIAWDFWDHNRTVSENRPILRKNLFDYLDEMKLSLLDDPQTGIMAVVDGLQKEILESADASSRTRQ